MRKILVIRLSAMGDAAMTSPVVDSVCRSHADVHVTMLSDPMFEPFFARHPNFRFVGTDIRRQRSGLTRLWRLFRTLSKTDDFDTVIDLHDVLRTKVLRAFFRLSGRKVYVINKGRNEKKALTRLENKVKVQLKPTIERYADVFAAAGLPTVVDTYPLKRAGLPDSLLALTGPHDGVRWVGISPFAQHMGKVYPLDKMERLIEMLCSDRRLKVFVFGGGKHEKAIAQTFEKLSDNCVSMVGKVSFAEEMQLMSHLDCMVSMDSSAMHICSLFGTRVISVWGATHPYAGFLGYRQSPADAMQLDLPCRPCSIYGNKPCASGTKYDCLQYPPEGIAAHVHEAVFGQRPKQ